MESKSLFNAFVTIFSLIVFSQSCEKNVPELNDSFSNENHVNICVLGNSYSNDAFSYVPFILKEYGYTCKIEIYYRGSMSLHDLDEQWYDESQYGLADLDGKNHIRLHFSIDTRKQTKWKKESVVNAQKVVSSQKWDIISIQQGGSRAQYMETYDPYLQNVIDRITHILNHTNLPGSWLITELRTMQIKRV